MADFKSALKAMGQGRLQPNLLRQQIDKIIKSKPELIEPMLAQLRQAFDHQYIGKDLYESISSHINSYKQNNNNSEDATVAVASTAEKHGSATSMPGDEGISTEINAAMGIADQKTNANQQAVPAAEESSAGPLGIGHVLKHRFKLLGVLGQGGMGKVFKGIDLLKEEARDKNPYVAIKLLNEDFKRHPEAFIALQRESSRQQKLAHPNIATVYDFDRIGSTGTQVFITMELMEGEPLNTIIRNKVKPEGGMDFDEAFHIIQGLGNALIYAHNRKIVHSDFKPGNSFLCNDGTVKVLDFGIARAVKNPQAGDGEKTLFDPGKLGALTPAYASLEMLEGEDPDTRDDIYALGCVAYELLTGNHPYNKTPANVARDKKMTPPVVKGLKRKQNKALAQSVAFERSKRSPDVEYFLEGLEGKFQWNNPWFIAAMTALLTVAIGTYPALNYMHNKKIAGYVSQINLDDRYIGDFLQNQLPLLSSDDKKVVLDGARDGIQSYFRNRILQVANPAATGLLDYPQANMVLAEAGKLYPDSLWLNQLKSKINDEKNQELYTRNKKYITYLEQRNLIESDESEEITDILREIRMIDPNHALLDDRRLSTAYRNTAESEIASGRLQEALAYVESGLKHSPRDADLVNLRDKIKTETRIAEIDAELRGQIGQLTELQQIKQLEEPTLELASLRPNHELLQQLTDLVRPLVETELARILSEGNRDDAEAAISDYGDLLAAMKLNTERNELQLAHISGAEREAKITEILAESRNRLGELLAQSAARDASWELQVQVNIQQLRTLSGEDNSSLSQFRDQVVDLYSPTILDAANDKRFTEAYALLDRTSEITAAAPQLEQVRGQVVELENAYIKQREEEERKSRVEGYKTEFIAAAKAFDVDAASSSLKQLQAELPASDPFLTTDATVLLEAAYLRVGEDAAKESNYQYALDKIKEGILLLPSSGKLEKISNEYQLELDVSDARALLTNLANVDITAANQALARVRIASPDRYKQLSGEYTRLYAMQIDDSTQSNKPLAEQLARIGTQLFPGAAELKRRYDELQVPAWDSTPAAAAINAGRLNEAGDIISQAPSGDPGAVEMQQQLDSRKAQAEQLIANYRQQIQAGRNNLEVLNAVLNTAEEAKSIWTDNEVIDNDLIAIRKQINELQQKNQAGARSLLTQEQDIASIGPAGSEQTDTTATTTPTPTPSGNTPEEVAPQVPESADDTDPATTGGDGTSGEAVATATPPPTAPWTPVSSGQECSARLAGYGKRSRALCFDAIGDGGLRGPLMIVVPAGDAFASPFAISKYELSVNDYNKYCYVSKKCAISKTDKDLPITGLSIAEIDTYLAWISERTNKVYRLPTAAEWRYAASSAGKQPKKDFNCRVVLGEKLLKGTGLISVKSGVQNSWGLKNYLGNAQELVRDGGALMVFGGAYEDSLSSCAIDLNRSHSGNADDITGFRVVLEKIL